MPQATHIARITTRDARFALEGGAGADAIHGDPQYSYAVAVVHTDSAHTGSGLAFTLGGGNDLVCRAIELLSEALVGRDIEEVMADFGSVSRSLADHSQLRWLGPHKGVIHLALAALTNGCFDLWAKARGVPLWQLLLDLTPEQTVALLDLSYLDDMLTREDALDLLRQEAPQRPDRMGLLERGYPGYDTSVGWFRYGDDEIGDNARRALDQGFTAMKLKVGSRDPERDLRRARIVRDAVGPQVRLMLDVNQQWTVPQALDMGQRLRDMSPYWIEEPTHPDDVLGHRRLAEALAPISLAVGEHVPNRVIFKNYLQAEAAGFVQVDALRVAGVSEFIAVSLLCRLCAVPVVPHVGDMGQLHQHLVLYNHIALGLPEVFLECIPHLRDRFVHPADVVDGVYGVPREPGASCDLI